MNVESDIGAVVGALSGKRILITDEKSVQADIELEFANAGVGAVREVEVVGGVIDFVVGSVGVEVKIKGQPAAIVRQIRAYLRDPRLAGLVLVTLRPIACPESIFGKPVRVFDLGRSWL